MRTVHLKFLPLFLLLLFSSCKIQPVVPTGVQDVKFGKIDPIFGSAELEMGLKINNPNAFTITVQSFDLDIAVAGVPMGKVSLEEKFRIKRKTEDVYPLKVKANITDLIRNIPKLLDAIAKKQSDVEVKGSIRVGSGLIRHTFPVDFKQEKVNTSRK